MPYIYNNSVSLEENIFEIEVYGEFRTVNEEEEMRTIFENENLTEEDIEKLIEAYLRGLAKQY